MRILAVILVSMLVIVLFGCSGWWGNDPPAIEEFAASKTEVGPGEEITINVVANDPDNDDMSYEYQVSGGTIAGTGDLVTWKAPEEEGSYFINVIVSDQHDAQVHGSITVTVGVNGRINSEDSGWPQQLEELWTVAGSVRGLATGDFNGDARDELIVATGGMVCLYDSSGIRLNCIGVPSDVSRIRVADLNGDGQLEVVGFRDPWGHRLIALKNNGETFWEYQPESAIDDVAVLDVEGDGTQEIAIGFNGSTGLYLLDFDGKVRWKYTQIGNVWHVSGGDLNNDGAVEVVSTSARGMVHVFDAQGELLTSHDLGMYANFVSVGEFIGNSRGPEMVASGVEGDREVLMVLDGRGNILWEFDPGKAFDAHPEQVAYLSQEGMLAIGTRDGQVCVLDSDGTVVAHVRELGERILVTWIKDERGTPILVAGGSEGLSAYPIAPDR